MEQATRECPEALREHVFGGRQVVSWQRAKAFQLVALKRIVAEVLAVCGSAVPQSSRPMSKRLRGRVSARGQGEDGGGRGSESAAADSTAAGPGALTSTRDLFLHSEPRLVTRLPGDHHALAALFGPSTALDLDSATIGRPITLAYSAHNAGARRVALALSELVEGCDAAL